MDYYVIFNVLVPIFKVNLPSEETSSLTFTRALEFGFVNPYETKSLFEMSETTSFSQVLVFLLNA